MFKKITLIMLAALLVLALTGCDQEESEQTGLANPASVYCQELGYTEETRMGEDGEYSVCIFADGSECDSWAFLGGWCGQEHSYCLQQGFALQASNETNVATCLFTDDSSCNEYEYQQGQCKPGDNKP